MDPFKSPGRLLSQHAQRRLHVSDVEAHHGTSLPLPGGCDGPEAATTTKVKDSGRRFIKVVQSQTLATVRHEHVIPMVEVEQIIRVLEWRDNWAGGTFVDTVGRDIGARGAGGHEGWANRRRGMKLTSKFYSKNCICRIFDPEARMAFTSGLGQGR